MRKQQLKQKILLLNHQIEELRSDKRKLLNELEYLSDNTISKSAFIISILLYTITITVVVGLFNGCIT